VMRVSTIWLISGCAAALVAGIAGWSVGRNAFGEEGDRVERSIQTYSNFLGEVRDQREERPDLEMELADSFDRMLGPDIQTVDNAVRARLAILAQACGLGDMSVSIPRTTVLESPAKRTFSRSGTQRAFRDEPDFVEVGASIGARGRIGEIVKFLHRLDATPWLKRIDWVRIDPEGKGRQLRLSVRLSTIFVPGRVSGEVDLEPNSRWPLHRYQGLIAANPFASPARPVPDGASPVVPPPPPPLVDPRANWRLTGIVEGPDGIEAWLVNLPQQIALEIRLGEDFDQFTLREAEGDIATFVAGDETFRILVGSTLDRPLP
jgi:hypothetical protein